MAECNEGVNFCSSCGQRRALKHSSTCAMCGRDFSSSVETDSDPYLDWFRKLFFNALLPQPSLMTELHEPNVPIEVFQKVFAKYGRLLDGITGQLLAVDASNNNREILISKRVIWRKEELDSLCKFESVDEGRGHGAGMLLSSGLGCAALIPPLTVTHYRCSDGEQRLVLRFGHALLNNSSQLFLPADQILDHTSYSMTPPPSPNISPNSTLDPPLDIQSHIMEMVGAYPAKLHRFGVAVPMVLLDSARDMLSRLRNEKEPTADEKRAKKLGEWASKATEKHWSGGKRMWPLTSRSASGQ